MKPILKESDDLDNILDLLEAEINGKITKKVQWEVEREVEEGAWNNLSYIIFSAIQEELEVYNDHNNTKK